MNQNNPRAILLLISAMLAFLVGDTLLKKLLGTLPFWQLFWLRTLCSMLAITLFITATGRWNRLSTKKPLQLLLRGVFLAIISICYYLSVEHFPLSVVATAFAGAPLIIAAISPIILKESATGVQWLATVIGFAGVCLVLKPGISQFSWFYLALLSLPFCYASMMLWSKRLSETESDWALNFYSYFPLIIISTYHAFAGWQPLSPGTLTLIFLSGTAAAVGFVLLVAAFRIGQPVIIAPFEYSAIVMALIADIAFWQFVPDYWIGTGILLIAICGLIQGWQARIQTPVITPHLRPEDTHTP